MPASDKLVELLSNDKLYEALVNGLIRARVSYWDFLDDPLDSNEEDSVDEVSAAPTNGQDSRKQSAIDFLTGAIDRNAIVDVKVLRPILDKHVFSQIPFPPPVTYEDLEEEIFRYLGGRVSSELPLAAQQLQSALRYMFEFLGGRFELYWEDEPEAEFDFGEWIERDRSEFGTTDTETRFVLWESPGFELASQELRDKQPKDRFACDLVLSGSKCTSRAYENVQKLFGDLVPVAYRCVSDLLKMVHPEERGSYELTDGEYRTLRPGMLPRGPLLYKFAIPFLKNWISYYFLTPAKKTHNLEQRLRNAVHLMVAADQQRMAAIAMALDFSAIEALLCSRQQGIVDELSRNVATLLQPDARSRQETIKAVKKLYDLRSKAMHGEQLTNDSEARDQVRLLAAAVFSAILDWQAYQKRVGDTSGRNDFLNELESAKTSGSAFIGPNERLAKCLPLSP